MFLFRACCANHVLWGFQHVAGFRRRHVGASIPDTSAQERVRDLVLQAYAEYEEAAEVAL